MIEKVVFDYLSAQLDVPVFMELPEVPSESFPEWPAEFVLIEKVGESVRDHVRTSSFALQSYSLTSLFHAAELDEQVREVMDVMAEETDVTRSHMSSNYNFTDTRTKRYRYQCVYDIVYIK